MKCLIKRPLTYRIAGYFCGYKFLRFGHKIDWINFCGFYFCGWRSKRNNFCGSNIGLIKGISSWHLKSSVPQNRPLAIQMLHVFNCKPMTSLSFGIRCKHILLLFNQEDFEEYGSNMWKNQQNKDHTKISTFLLSHISSLCQKPNFPVKSPSTIKLTALSAILTSITCGSREHFGICKAAEIFFVVKVPMPLMSNKCKI